MAKAKKGKVSMGKYVYKIGKEVVERAAFVRFVAEECAPNVINWCGFGIAIGDYKQGEEVTKAMQARAYRDYKRTLGKIWADKRGVAVSIYGGVKKGCLTIEYLPQ